MLNNLKAELVRKGLDPVSAIAASIGCTEKTARNKLDEGTSTTVSEAAKIIDTYFAGDSFTMEFLFTSFKEPI